jgi:methionyl-tRNA formyltransferase
MERGVILLTKQDQFSRMAQNIARETFDVLTIFEGKVADVEPKALGAAEPRFLISFLSPWIVRQAVLDRCDTAINFHPGPVEYPGIGCYNFAIYEAATEFGAVCHHMLSKVDTGPIIIERRFPMASGATVEELKLATMLTMIGMFRDVAAMIAAGDPLPLADTAWARKPFTRRQLEALKLCDHEMGPDEIERRVRSTTYPGYAGPVLIHADGSRHVFPVPNRPPLA